ncbi:MAG: adenylate/guanylate cyclase domain-containing protein [Bacteroidota bacterium]
MRNALFVVLLLGWLNTSVSQSRPDLLPQKNWPTSEVQFRSLFSSLHNLSRNAPNQALNLGHELIGLGKEKDWFLGEASYFLGLTCWYQGAYKSALGFFKSALEDFETENNQLGIAQSYQGLGMAEWRFANFPGANKYFINSLKIREAEDDSLGLMHSFYWLGIIRADLEQFEESADYYLRSLTFARLLLQKQHEADVLNVMGRSWRKQKVYDKALSMHVASFHLYQELQDSLGMSDYFNNVGSIYRRQGKLDQALTHFFQALAIQLKLQDREGLADGYNDIGTTLMQKGAFMESVDYLNRGLVAAREAGLLDDVRYAYKSLSAVHDSLRNYDLAYDYFIKFTQVKDSIYDLATQNLIGQQLDEYEREKVLAENQARKEAGSQRVRFWVTLFISLLALAAAVTVFFFWQNRINARNARQLEAKNTLINIQKDRAEKLLLNILPAEIADELKLSPSGQVKTRHYDSVSVMFLDFKDFTRIAEILSPEDLVAELHHCFKAFDQIIEDHDIEKIKTIGDAYLCAGGIPIEDPAHAINTVKAALDIQAYLSTYGEQRKRENRPFFQARVGVHTGPLIAGVVGIKKFAYDIWGDTVNTAARIEASGEVGKVNISSSTYQLIKDLSICTYRGKVPVKNKGEVDMFFVDWVM